MIVNALKTYGIYLHYPYCVSKCHYCDFNSYAISPDPGWAEGVRLQFAQDDPFRTSHELASIYFGGGTPSLLSAGEVEMILNSLLGSQSRKNVEITLETNPGTVNATKLKELFQVGVNRLSIGVQSFDENVLRFLGRTHSGGDARNTLDLARRAGFENVGLDLILGSRESSARSLDRDLRTVEAFAPEHVSVYFLTVEGRTPFTRRQKKGERLTLPEKDQLHQYKNTIEALQETGLKRYEISNLARKGRKSVHNRLYWWGNEYLGLGPGASGFTYREFPDRATRKKTMTDPSEWLNALKRGKSPTAEHEALGIAELALERIMLELRTSEGLDLQNLSKTYGIDLFSNKKDDIVRMVDADLLDFDNRNQRLRLTDEGILVADSVILSLV